MLAPFAAQAPLPDDVTAQTALPDDEQDTLIQDAALRQAFADQQRERYGETYPDHEEDEETLLQAQLARDFATMQRSRYGEEHGPDTEQDAPAILRLNRQRWRPLLPKPDCLT